MKKLFLTLPLAALMIAGTSQGVQAEGRLTIYCSAQGDWCQKAAETFGKKIRCESLHDAQWLGKYIRKDTR